MIEFVLAAIVAAIIFYYLWQQKCKDYNELKSSKASQSVRYGKVSEQFFPFLDKYPYDRSGFRFLGSPIDGIQFNDDKLVFVEFKTNSSVMTDKERNIKQLVEKGKVEFEEVRIK